MSGCRIVSSQWGCSYHFTFLNSSTSLKSLIGAPGSTVIVTSILKVDASIETSLLRDSLSTYLGSVLVFTVATTSPLSTFQVPDPFFSTPRTCNDSSSISHVWSFA